MKILYEVKGLLWCSTRILGHSSLEVTLSRWLETHEEYSRICPDCLPSSSILSFYPSLTPFLLHRIFLSKWPEPLKHSCLSKNLLPFLLSHLQIFYTHCLQLLFFFLQREIIFKDICPWLLNKRVHVKLLGNCFLKSKYSISATVCWGLFTHIFELFLAISFQNMALWWSFRCLFVSQRVQSSSAVFSLPHTVTEQQHSEHFYSEESQFYFCGQLSSLIEM